jgi:hypothetical protein
MYCTVRTPSVVFRSFLQSALIQLLVIPALCGTSCTDTPVNLAGLGYALLISPYMWSSVQSLVMLLPPHIAIN